MNKALSTIVFITSVICFSSCSKKKNDDTAKVFQNSEEENPCASIVPKTFAQIGCREDLLTYYGQNKECLSNSVMNEDKDGFPEDNMLISPDPNCPFINHYHFDTLSKMEVQRGDSLIIYYSLNDNYNTTLPTDSVSIYVYPYIFYSDGTKKAIERQLIKRISYKDLRTMKIGNVLSKQGSLSTVNDTSFAIPVKIPLPETKTIIESGVSKVVTIKLQTGNNGFRSEPMAQYPFNVTE